MAEQELIAVISGDEKIPCGECGKSVNKNKGCEKHRGPKNSHKMKITGSNYNQFLGKKIGDIVDGIFVGEGETTLSGYKLQICGGSDKTGTPMRSDLAGGNRKSVLVSASVGSCCPLRKHQTSSSADALDPSTKYPSLGWYVAARSSSSSSGTSSVCGVGGAFDSGTFFFEGGEPHP